MKYKVQELLGVVKGLSEKYTQKESSSISYEAAQQLMGAVIYCLQEAETESEDEDSNAIISLQEEKFSAKEEYEKGYLMVTQKIIKANELYVKIMESFEGYGNEAYIDTVKTAVNEFFRYYDPKLKPQDSIITMDYPVLCNMQGRSGIDAIYQYLQAIDLEQRFLHHFPKAYIKESLIEYHLGYAELFINICAVVLQKILFKALEQIKEREFDPIETREEITSACQKLLWEFTEREYKGDWKLYDYLNYSVPDIVSEYLLKMEYQIEE